METANPQYNNQTLFSARHALQQSNQMGSSSLPITLFQCCVTLLNLIKQINSTQDYLGQMHLKSRTNNKHGMPLYNAIPEHNSILGFQIYLVWQKVSIKPTIHQNNSLPFVGSLFVTATTIPTYNLTPS
jgi:hypothetical protein